MLSFPSSDGEAVSAIPAEKGLRRCLHVHDGDEDLRSK